MALPVSRALSLFEGVCKSHKIEPLTWTTEEVFSCESVLLYRMNYSLLLQHPYRPLRLILSTLHCEEYLQSCLYLLPTSHFLEILSMTATTHRFPSSTLLISSLSLLCIWYAPTTVWTQKKPLRQWGSTWTVSRWSAPRFVRFTAWVRTCGRHPWVISFSLYQLLFNSFCLFYQNGVSAWTKKSSFRCFWMMQHPSFLILFYYLLQGTFGFLITPTSSDVSVNGDSFVHFFMSSMWILHSFLPYGILFRHWMWLMRSTGNNRIYSLRRTSICFPFSWYD